MSKFPPGFETGQKRLIVVTARRLYRQLGPRKTTVADIARELRMSPANIYRFFGSTPAIENSEPNLRTGWEADIPAPFDYRK
jgi:Bacterial regulatory proteins, tetR family